MFLYACVREIVADSARKFPQVNRPIQLERFPTAVRAEQAKTPTASARRHGTDRKAMPEPLQSICHVNNLAVLYNPPSVESGHDCPPSDFQLCPQSCAP